MRDQSPLQPSSDNFTRASRSIAFAEFDGAEVPAEPDVLDAPPVVCAAPAPSCRFIQTIAATRTASTTTAADTNTIPSLPRFVTPGVTTGVCSCVRVAATADTAAG